jgi:isochorismate synthase EntC
VAGGRFLGASPELLVSRRGGSARCHPLAGTVALTGDPEGDRAAVERLRASGKDRGEHAVVVRAIVEALRASGGVVPEPGPPEIVRLRSVAHLATEVVARYRDAARAPDALELLAALHPTPAVGGFPTEVALQAIRQLEAAPRRSWAGPVGWVDHVGNGDWVIGIRSATVRGRRAWLWAGAGVVAESDPASELAETTVKLLPVADALLPGVDLEFLGRSEYRGSLPGV